MSLGVNAGLFNGVPEFGRLRLKRQPWHDNDAHGHLRQGPCVSLMPCRDALPDTGAALGRDVTGRPLCLPARTTANRRRDEGVIQRTKGFERSGRPEEHADRVIRNHDLDRPLRLIRAIQWRQSISIPSDCASSVARLKIHRQPRPDPPALLSPSRPLPASAPRPCLVPPSAPACAQHARSGQRFRG